jgi:hypothetical protein
MRHSLAQRPIRRFLLAACLAGPVLFARQDPAGGAEQQAAARPPSDAAFKPFLDQAKAYVELRKRQESGLPPLKTTDQPEKLHEHRVLLAKKIQRARSGAKRGDVFAGSEGAFRKQIAEAFSGSQGRSLKRTIVQGEPVKLELHVNDVYPERIPVTTVPPTLIQQLPRLPEGMEYRIVDRDFILEDAKSRLVVDFIPDALPEPASQSTER